MPWLHWNYQKQDYRAREFVVVIGDEGADASCHPPGTTVVRCPRATSVARKRNLAVEAARGDVVAWFDDDDWQHPRRLTLLARALAGGAGFAGSAGSWLVDLRHGRARAHRTQHGVLFNGLGVRRDALRTVRFDERRERAADTGWLGQVRRAASGRPTVLPEMLSFWLCHEANLSNPSKRYVFPHPLTAVRESIGAAGWGDTDAQLDALRRRLGLRLPSGGDATVSGDLADGVGSAR